MTSWLRREAEQAVLKQYGWTQSMQALTQCRDDGGYDGDAPFEDADSLEQFGLRVLAEVEQRLKQQVGESGVGEPGVIVTPVTIVRSLREEQ